MSIDEICDKIQKDPRITKEDVVERHWNKHWAFLDNTQPSGEGK